MRAGVRPGLQILWVRLDGPVGSTPTHFRQDAYASKILLSGLTGFEFWQAAVRARQRRFHLPFDGELKGNSLGRSCGAEGAAGVKLSTDDWALASGRNIVRGNGGPENCRLALAAYSRKTQGPLNLSVTLVSS